MESIGGIATTDVGLLTRIRDLAAVAIRRAQWAAEVLLAEDGEVVRSALPAVLRRFGFEPVEG